MRQELEAAIAAVVKNLYDVELRVELTRPSAQFGDYATNVALQLSSQLHQTPRDIAADLVNRLQEQLKADVRAVEMAGPGFLNLTLSDERLIGGLDTQPAQTLSGQVVTAEYSDPNPFKVLHAGHLYTTLVGDAIANLLTAAGATVHRLNFGGDVGLHVGKTMWAILENLGGEYPDKLTNINSATRLDWLSGNYVRGNNAYEDNEPAKAAIITLNKRIYAIHEQDDHDSALAQIYWTCRRWSYDGFTSFYEQLAVQPFEKYYPESEVAGPGLELVKQGLSSGVFTASDGAVVFAGERHGLHTRVFINSQGLPTYETKDLGLAVSKWQQYHYDRSLIITANEQVQYMQVVLQALQAFYPEAAARTTHLTHGLIKLAGSVKMSSRKGNILRAEDVLKAAAAASQESTGHQNQETVLGAVKYAFLKQRTGADIIYDPNESISIIGNSGPYLQYAYARACSILRKGGTPSLTGVISLEPAERFLARQITIYPEVVEQAVAELMPHHICTYLYELAQIFNHFYEHNRVVGDQRESLRLALVTAYTARLGAGLSLLGIAAPDKL